MEDRMTLCNMVVDAGAKNGVVPADSTTFKYLEGKTTIPYEPVSSDGAASFLQEYRFDVSKLEPVVAKVWFFVLVSLANFRMLIVMGTYFVECLGRCSS
jgi:homoaconitase/3-isopropylmalate dehydratase large subunit